MAGFPVNWTQEASDNLKAIARSAVGTALTDPGDDINPLYGKLQSAVRFEPQTGYFVITYCTPGGTLRPLHRRSRDEAWQALREGWGHELYGGFALKNPYTIVRDDILGALGSMAAGDW